MNRIIDKKTQDLIIGIHQPNYIPWLGYFYKIYQSNIFVFLDDVQFSNKGMHNYSYIKTPLGSYRLKIPVKQSLGDKIYEVVVKDELGWKDKHLDLIRMNYKKAPFFEEVFSDLKTAIMSEYTDISELNMVLIKLFTEKLGFDTVFAVSSELGINLSKEEKILGIIKELDGNVYYSGTGARAYQNEGSFNDKGIELRYSEYKVFEYPQLWDTFQSNVSAIDYFMNCGYNWIKVLENQRK